MPANPIATGFKDVQDRVMAFAKENGESALTFAGKVSKASTFQELLTLQTQFAQSQMNAFTTHTQELLKLIGEAFQKCHAADLSKTANHLYGVSASNDLLKSRFTPSRPPAKELHCCDSRKGRLPADIRVTPALPHQGKARSSPQTSA